MQRAAKLIRARQDDFPDCAYYLPLLGKARRNARSHPDICIETCKAVLEGISKTIVLDLDGEASKEQVDKKDVDQMVKWAAKTLQKNDDVVEDNFVTRATSLANALGALRNSRSDISHGREVPKPEYSEEKFARLCLSMTDSIAVYMLESYFHHSQSEVEEPDKDQLKESETYLPDIKYEENAEFNDWLDQINPLPGKMLYSEALFRLYIEDYVIELDQFNEADDPNAADGEAYDTALGE